MKSLIVAREKEQAVFEHLVNVLRPCDRLGEVVGWTVNAVKKRPLAEKPFHWYGWPYRQNVIKLRFSAHFGR